MLDPAWRGVWGDPVHPMDRTADVRKAIVLLTDGEDNHVSDAWRHRRTGCTAAKDAGITVFTIAAMHPNHVGTRLAEELRKCSS